MPLVEDIVTLLTAASLGIIKVDLFYSSRAILPDGDGPYTTLIETAGLIDEWIQNDVTRPAFEHGGAQLVTRAAHYIDARNKALAIYAEINKVHNQYIGTTWYRRIHPLQRPFDAGPPDEHNRALIKFNVLGERSPYV